MPLLFPLILRVFVCVGTPQAEINKQVDAARAVNPQVTIIVREVKCLKATVRQ